MAQRESVFFGKIAIKLGLVPPDAVRECLRIQKEHGGNLGDIMVLEGHITEPDRIRIVQQQKKLLAREARREKAGRGGGLLGRMLVEEGLVSQENLNRCLRAHQEEVEQGGARRLGEVLVAEGLLSIKDLKRLLRKQDKTILRCASCGKQYNVSGWRPGRVAHCKNCGEELQETTMSTGGVPRIENSVPSMPAQAEKKRAPAPQPPETEGAPPPAQGQPKPPADAPVVAGRYALERLLGETDTGDLYGARDLETDGRVCVKIISAYLLEDAGLQDAMRDAAATLEDISADHIPAPREILEDGRNLFVVLPPLDGQRLSEILEAGDIGVKKLVGLLTRLAFSLDRLHRGGLALCNIRAENLLLDTGDNALIATDFCFARPVSPSDLDEGLVDFQAADPADDQFLLAAILYRAISGRDVVAEVFGGEAGDFIPALADEGAGDQWLADVVDRAMSFDRGARYSSIVDLARDLTRWSREGGGGRGGRGGKGRVRRSASGRGASQKTGVYIAVGGGVIAVLALVIIGAFLFFGGSDDNTGPGEMPTGGDSTAVAAGGSSSLGGAETARKESAAVTKRRRAEEFSKQAFAAAKAGKPLSDVFALHEKALAADPSFAAPAMYMGVDHFLAGDGEAAKTQLNRALKRDANYEPALYFRALTRAFLDGDRRGALADMRRIAANDASYYQVLAKGWRMYLGRETTEAATWAKWLSGNDEYNNWDARLLSVSLASITRDRESLEQTQMALDSSIAAHPMALGLILARARVRYAARNFKGAIDDATGILDLTGGDRDSTFVAAYLVRARSLMAVGQPDEGLKDLTFALFHDKNNATAYFLRGLCHYQGRRFPDAIKDFERAAKADPTDANPHIGMAQTYLALGKTDRVLPALALAERAQPNSDEVFLVRGQFLLSSGNPQKAKQQFDRAISISPRRWGLYLWRAQAFQGMKMVEPAVADLEKYVAGEPAPTLQAVVLLGKYYLRNLRDARRALKLLEEGDRRFRDGARKPGDARFHPECVRLIDEARSFLRDG